jgi:hypothetical protein
MIAPGLTYGDPIAWPEPADRHHWIGIRAPIGVFSGIAKPISA